MIHERLPHWTVSFSFILFLFSLLIYIILSIHHPIMWLKLDLKEYYTAGQDALSGKNVYITPNTNFNFLYTPITAVFFSYLSLIPFTIGKFIFTGISILSLIVTVRISLGLVKAQSDSRRWMLTWLITTLLFWTEPIQQTLNFGQINLLLMALIMVGFSHRMNGYWSGVFIGLATSIKLTPGIFIAYLFFTRRFLAGIISIAVFLSTVILGFLILPPDAILYWSGLFLNTNRVGDVMLVGDQSLNAMISRMAGSIDGAKPFWMFFIVLVGLIGLYISAKARKRHNELLGVVLCAFTGLLVSPFSWSHHWVWIAPLLVYLIYIALETKSVFAWFSVVIVCIVFGWFSPFIPGLSSLPDGIIWGNTDFSMKDIALFQQNPYVVAGILVLCISGFYLIYKTKFVHRMQRFKLAKMYLRRKI
jgi:alpha-1,2-mannosyltransferase